MGKKINEEEMKTKYLLRIDKYSNEFWSYLDDARTYELVAGEHIEKDDKLDFTVNEKKKRIVILKKRPNKKEE